MNVHRLICAAIVGCAIVACDDSDSRVAGNSANTGNAQAMGRLLTPDGGSASDVRVTCRPDTLLPWETTRDAWHVVTDSAGVFRCAELPPGPVAVEANDPATGLTSWRSLLLRAGSVDTAPADTVAAPGRLRVALAPATTGTLVLSGLGRSIPVRGEEEILIPGIPARWTGSVRLVRSNPTPLVVASNLRVPAGGIDSAGYTRSFATIRVGLPGGLKTPLVDFALLVRLDSSWNGFPASLEDGSDLRLALPGGKALPLRVASWDKAARTGELWTVLDTIQPPGDSVDLLLSWGIPVPSASTASPFSAARGWAAAWPLGDTGARVADLVGAYPGAGTALGSVAGAVGRASNFDGRLSGVEIPNSESGTFDFPVGGPYTLSCWVRLRDFGTSRHIMGQGDFDYFLKFQKDWSTNNLWMAKDSRSTPKGGFFSFAKADTARWTHLAMVVQDSTVRLYVGGVLSDSGTYWDPDASAKHARAFHIGYTVDTTGTDAQHFYGAIDEAWVQARVRSSDWIRFAAGNQNPAAPRARALSR